MAAQHQDIEVDLLVRLAANANYKQLPDSVCQKLQPQPTNLRFSIPAARARPGRQPTAAGADVAWAQDVPPERATL